MNIQLVYSFMALCKYKNISTASQHLNISQQGLSKQIKTLESELNTNLFTRSRLGVELTECGIKLEPFFQDIISNYESILNVVNNELCVAGDDININIGIGYGITSAIGLDFISDFKKIYPETNIHLLELYDRECEDKLVKNELDFCFLVEPFDDTKFFTEHIYSDSTCAVISDRHPYFNEKTELHLADLHDQSIMIADENYILKHVFDQCCEKIDCKPDICFTTSNIASYINLPNDLEAISIGINFFRKYISNEHSKTVPLLGLPEYNVHFCSSKSKVKNQKDKKFEMFIKEYFKTSFNFNS